MKRAPLIFDLDGTLVDSMPDLRAALNEMLAEWAGCCTVFL
jgi:phosphoglycolate phosphatase-like HAD superfamily hydrolase